MVTTSRQALRRPRWGLEPFVDGSNINTFIGWPYVMAHVI